MTNYVKSTDFAVKDSLISGNPSKLVKGAEINTEFAAIQIADATSVKGPGSSVDNAIMRFDGTAGYTAQTSSVTISDGGVISGASAAAARADTPILSQVQDGSIQLLGSVAGINTITGNLTPAITSYTNGQTFRFIAAGANTGAVTININGLGAKAITKAGTTALETGDIASGAAIQIVYDGTQFQLTSGAGGGAKAGGVMYENSTTLTSSYTLTTGRNAMMVGPLTINSGVVLTVPSGQRMVVL